MNLEIRPGYVVEFPDSMSQGDVNKAAKKLYAAGEPPKKGLAQRGLDLLPGAGAMAMSTLAGGGGIRKLAPFIPPNPLGIAAADFGGMGGEAFKQIGYHALGLPGAPETSLEAGGRIANAGVEQGAYEAVGRGTGKLLHAGGQALMESAIGRGSKELAGTAIKEGIKTTQEGMNRLLRRIGQASGTRDQLVQAAKAAGHAANPGDLTIGLNKIAEDLKLAGDEEGFRRIQKWTWNFYRRKIGRALPTADKVYRIRQIMDDIADPIHKLVAEEKYVPPASLLRAKWAKTIADNARNWLHGIPGTATYGIPVFEEIAKADARASQLIGVRDAIRPAARAARSFGSKAAPRAIAGLAAGGAGAAGGAAFGGGSVMDRVKRGSAAGAAGMAAGSLVGSPGNMSALALKMSHPMWGPAIANLLRLAGMGAEQIKPPAGAPPPARR